MEEKYIIKSHEKMTRKKNRFGTLREKFEKHNIGELLDDYDYEMNYPLTPENSYGSKYSKIYLKCSKGHQYSMTVGNRMSGHGCPYCSGRAVITGKTDLLTVFPEWGEKWSKNNQIEASKISWCSGKMGKFICDICEEEFETKIASISYRKGSGGCICKKCAQKLSAKRISEKIGKLNPIACTDPDVMKFWDYDKNSEIDPFKISRGSEKYKVNWKCPVCEFEWSTTPNQMTYKNRGCPECTKKKTHKEASIKAAIKNNLEEKFPEIAAEFSERNEMDVKLVSAGSGIEYIWKCSKCGHEYLATPNSRTSIGRGCSKCQKIRSVPQAIVNKAINKFFKTEYNTKKVIDNLELDIYIPELNTAIEYDGRVWHGNAKYNTTYKRDSRKNKKCIEKGIRLIRIRERPLRKLKHCENILIYCKNAGSRAYYKSFADLVNEIYKEIGVDYIIDEKEIREFYMDIKMKNDI